MNDLCPEQLNKLSKPAKLHDFALRHRRLHRQQHQHQQQQQQQQQQRQQQQQQQQQHQHEHGQGLWAGRPGD